MSKKNTKPEEPKKLDEAKGKIKKGAKKAKGKIDQFREDHPRISRGIGIAGAGLALFASYALGYNAGSKSGDVPEGAVLIDADEQDNDQMLQEDQET